MPTGQKPSHRILTKSAGGEKNDIEIGAAWKTSKEEVLSATIKIWGHEVKAIIVPNRPKEANAKASDKKAAT